MRRAAGNQTDARAIEKAAESSENPTVLPSYVEQRRYFTRYYDVSLDLWMLSGDDRDRTGNLLVANQAICGDEKRCKILPKLVCNLHSMTQAFSGNYQDFAGIISDLSPILCHGRAL